MSNTIHVTDNTELTSLLTTHEEILLSFSTPSCARCKMLAPMVERVVDASGDGVQLVKVDLAQVPEPITEYGVQEVPAFIRIRNGQEIQRLTGMLSTETMVTLLEGKV